MNNVRHKAKGIGQSVEKSEHPISNKEHPTLKGGAAARGYLNRSLGCARDDRGRDSRYRRCDNCFFSLWMMGPNRPALTCKQRARFVGRRRIVLLDWSCPNFYPSGDFKLGSAAVRRIPLTQGKFALVDADDYYQLSKFNWFTDSCARTSYAARRQNQTNVMMHRLIMKAPDHLVVDHIDHNGLNNCKTNLRLCTSAQNTCNTTSRKGASKYKGLYRARGGKIWVAKIQFNGKKVHIGQFENEIDAAKAYDEKASQLHGEFACLNFPQEKLDRITG